jgi:hypothetical protein
MILICRPDTNEGNWTFADAGNYLSLSDKGLILDMGVPVPTHMPPLRVKILTKGQIADSFCAGLAWIVSERFRDFFSAMGVKAEYVKVSIRVRGKPYNLQSYYLFNLLDIVDCFDYVNSRYKQTPNGVTTIKRLVIDEPKAAGHHLFLLGPIPTAKTPNPRAVIGNNRCASEELAIKVRESGLNGLAFTLPKDRNIYPPPAWDQKLKTKKLQ